jgi:hypothetical protein
MTECWYVVDSNVLSRLTLSQRSSAFFREHCRIPSEVLYEASGFPDIPSLRKLEYRVTPEVLMGVREVMQTVEPGDFKLIDLYRNKGSADPVVIATALVEQRRGQETLFAPNWVVVSDDNAVRAKAMDMDLHILGAKGFADLLADWMRSSVPTTARDSTWND